MPIAEYHDQLTCGVGVVEMASGRTVATLEFATGVEEICDVQVVSRTRALTFGGSEGGAGDVWLVPAPH